MAQRTALFRPWPFVEGMIYSCGVRNVGSTERASAILRMVRGWTSVRPLVSILHTVLWFSSALSANSLCERNLCSRAALTFSPSILTSTSIVRLLCLHSQYPLNFKIKTRQKQVNNIQLRNRIETAPQVLEHPGARPTERIGTLLWTPKSLAYSVQGKPLRTI